MMPVLPSFYDADQIERIAINLFYGWGYNFYRLENQVRADDLLVRSKVGWLLGLARLSVETAESAYRREFLPPPSRQKPRHDAAAIAGAQRLERLSGAIGALSGRIGASPVPENNRMMQRHRDEAATLVRLLECDRRLAGQADMLRALLDGKTGSWMIDNAEAIEGGLAALTQSLLEREAALLI
jgi:hypothetical protein